MNRQPTVFLIDPDEAIQDAIKNLTTLMDLDCLAFLSGQDFLDGFDPMRPGCLVMELRVSGVNGLQIQQRLRESGAKIGRAHV